MPTIINHLPGFEISPIWRSILHSKLEKNWHYLWRKSPLFECRIGHLTQFYFLKFFFEPEMCVALNVLFMVTSIFSILMHFLHKPVFILSMRERERAYLTRKRVVSTCINFHILRYRYDPPLLLPFSFSLDFK